MVIEDGAFSAMTGISILTIIAGSFQSISPTAFAGLSSLSTLYLFAEFPTSGIPSGLFDGLEALTQLDMSRTNLYRFASFVGRRDKYCWRFVLFGKHFILVPKQPYTSSSDVCDWSVCRWIGEKWFCCCHWIDFQLWNILKHLEAELQTEYYLITS